MSESPCIDTGSRARSREQPSWSPATPLRLDRLAPGPARPLSLLSSLTGALDAWENKETKTGGGKGKSGPTEG